MTKKLLLLFAAIPFACFLICSSCKKTQHDTNPTPANYRLLSYTKTVDDLYPSDNYRFYYDSKNRVSEILFSTNDSDGIKVGAPISEKAVFSYSNDTIYKVISNVRNGFVFENDVFVKNTAGQVVNAFFPYESINYQYFGKLLSWVSDTFKRNGNTITTVRNYTSDNADLLSLNFDGNLYVTLEDSGLRQAPLAGQTLDTVLTDPLSITWSTVPPVTRGINSTTTVTGATVYNDKFSGYTYGYPVVISGTDANGINTPDTAVYLPGGTWPKESFGVFPDKANRTGDYWQLQSFTTCGVNIYQNAHLLKSDSSLGHKVYVDYTIDADSKITTTVATITDSVGHVHTEVYNLQYETY